MAEPNPTSSQCNHTALTAAMLTKYHGQKANESRCQSLSDPANTLDTENRFGLVATNIVKFRGDSPGHAMTDPLPTITSGAGSSRPAGAAHALGVAAAFLARFNHGAKQWDSVGDPLGTVTSQGNKFALVYAFLVKWYGTSIGQFLDEPLGTITTKPRFGLVTIEVEKGQYEPAIAFDAPGGPYVIADICLRMLTPRELARAQGFPDSYILTGSQANQVARIGNSVCPVMSKALAGANYDPKHAFKEEVARGGR